MNATIDGSTVKITDRNGNVYTYELEEWAGDENVIIQIASEVEGFTLAGHNIFVYFNGSEDAHATYTTDDEGKVTFTATHGSYYKVVYPDVAECQSVPSATYVAVLPKRNISVTYQGYTEEDKLETITIIIRKYSDVSTYTAWADVPVSVKIGTEDAKTMTSDSDGKITFQVAHGQTVTLTADKYEGYYVHNDQYTWMFTASEAARTYHYNYHAYRTGAFIIHTDGSKYTADEWTAGGFTKSEAVAITVVTANLISHESTATVEINTLYNFSYSSKQWCESNVLFEDIPTNGNSATANYYYDGKTASQLVIDEAAERGLLVPAFTYCASQTIVVNGVTYNGYVASVGQHYEFWYNHELVENCLTAVFGDSNNSVMTNKWAKQRKWTSTQCDATSAYYFFSAPFNYFKSDSYLAVPFYAC